MLPLTNMLTELRLSGFKRHLDSLEAQAIEQQWSHHDFLAKLCEHELAQRYQSRVSSWRKESALNIAKSLNNLDLSIYTTEVSQRIQKLQGNTEWARQASNVILFGRFWRGQIASCQWAGLEID